VVGFLPSEQTHKGGQAGWGAGSPVCETSADGDALVQVHLRHLAGGRARSYTGRIEHEKILQVQRSVRTAVLTYRPACCEHVSAVAAACTVHDHGTPLWQVVFPERPGALRRFLDVVSPAWNVTLFHYRNSGNRESSVLLGVQVRAADCGARIGSGPLWRLLCPSASPCPSGCVVAQGRLHYSARNLAGAASGRGALPRRPRVPARHGWGGLRLQRAAGRSPPGVRPVHPIVGSVCLCSHASALTARGADVLVASLASGEGAAHSRFIRLCVSGWRGQCSVLRSFLCAGSCCHQLAAVQYPGRASTVGPPCIVASARTFLRALCLNGGATLLKP
jgi:hypothetical protein